MSITFRANKGSGLTYAEMDRNFGSFFYSSSLTNNSQNLVLHYTGSPDVPVNSGSVTYSLISGLSNAGSDRRVALFSGSSTIVTEQGFVVDETGSVGIRVNESNLPLSYALDVSGSIRASGTVLQGSDERLKKDITPVDDALSKVDHLEGVYFKWKSDDKEDIGVIAQDIKEVLPEVVSEDNNGYLNVNYSGIVPVLIEAIKELKDRVEELENR
jgi:hypothetical protein